MERHLPAMRGVPVVEVIPSFREDGAEEPVDASVLAQLPDRPYVLFVGALREVKGVYELLEAYQRLDDAPPLVLIGTKAPDSPDSYPPGVTVLHDVPHGTVMAAWDRALFGVFPSRWPEPLGNVVHEAMSRGRAVIGTSPGGHRDMIEDGGNGLLVPAGDPTALATAMRRLLDEPDLRDEMGRRGRELAKGFTLSAVLPRFERLYDRVREARRA
jgi:glycosyltransferase involved in cell wall biosynthesis